MSRNTCDIPPFERHLTGWLEEQRLEAGIPGAAVVAFGPDGALAGTALGPADAARGEPVTFQTLFRAASISKLLTTAIVLQEVSAGKLSLDESFNGRVGARHRIRHPDGGPADEITPRHLLTHTAGLPVTWRGSMFGNRLLQHLLAGGRRPRTLAESVAGRRTRHPVGQRVVYENGGLALLGHLMAEANGMSFEQLARTKLLDPLKMRTSTFAMDTTGMPVATAYGGVRARTAGLRPAPVTRYVSAPAGALVTSAADLVLFGAMLLRGGEACGQQLVPADLLDEAMRLHAKNHHELDAGWGLGFAVSELRGNRQAAHNGELPGVAARLAVLPDHRLGALVLANGGDVEFVERATERVLESHLCLRPEPVRGRGMRPGSEHEWRYFNQRVAGPYRQRDFAPPGILTVITDRLHAPALRPLEDGTLALDGLGSPGLLHPDGELGRYRVEHAIGNGSRAIIEERNGGTHLWRLARHLQRRT